MNTQQSQDQDARSDKGSALSGVDLKAAVAGAVLAVLVMAPIGYKMMGHLEQKIEARLADAPPVAILDFTNAVATYAQSSDDNGEDLARIVQGVDSTIRKLSGAGFLVLDAKAVLSAPTSLYVPQAMIMGVDGGASSKPIASSLDATPVPLPGAGPEVPEGQK